MYQFCRTSSLVTDSCKWSCNTLCASKNVVYCCLSSTEVSSFCLSFLLCSYVYRFDTTLSKIWNILSNGLLVSVSVVPGIMVCVKTLHLVKHSTCFVFILLIISCFVRFLADFSLASASRSQSNSPSFSFGVSITKVDPS